MNCLNVSIEHSFLCWWLLRYPCLFLCDILTTLSDDHSVYSFGESPQAVSSLGSTRKSHRFDKSNRGNSSKALRKGRIAESESSESEQSSKEADSMDEDSSTSTRGSTRAKVCYWVASFRFGQSSVTRSLSFLMRRRRKRSGKIF